MKNLGYVLVAIVIVVLFASCAPSQPQIKEYLIGYQYGFFGGFWHGLIAPFSFIASLVNSDVSVWAINNNGGWYAFGFVLGIGGFSSLFSSSSE